MSSGYVYVLINPSMPGLVKVGMTTRSPEERVAELSAVTGVPSPFILAYQHHVADCAAAERWVHEQLASSRSASNREFFNAPLHEVVRVIAACDMSGSAADNEGSGGSGDLTADQLFDMGCEFQDGSDKVLRNPAKALVCFKQSAALGNAWAAIFAGNMLQSGDGVSSDREAALALFQRALALGHWEVLADIGGLFWEAGQIRDGASYWNRFFAEALAREQSGDPHLAKRARKAISSYGHRLVMLACRLPEASTYLELQAIAPQLDRIRRSVDDLVEFAKFPSAMQDSLYRVIKRWRDGSTARSA